jgi:hypothetical protein
MKKLRTYSLLALLSLTVFVACQKELSFEQPGPAVAKLRKDSLENCIPSLSFGTFVAGKVLTDSNAIQVEVDVDKTGSYTIQTDEVNGYSFKGTGTFSNTGVNVVRLTGTGTPAAAGINNFTVLYGDSSSCSAQVIVLPAGSGGPATFTLGATPNTCPAVSVSGTYSPGTLLTSANKIDFQVNVTAIGTYTLSTDTVNGFYFIASSAMTTTGVQTISLFGNGTPIAADSTTFKLRSGSTVCTFKVGVTGTTPPPPGGCVDSVQGTYVAGTSLNAANKVYLKHTYMAPGTFVVTTNAVNGFEFKDTVIVATGGTLTPIELNGLGTPAAAGVTSFTVSFGDASTCTFNVTVSSTNPPPPPPPSESVYFPLTRNSYWTYGETVFSPGDTLKRVVTDSVLREGQLYRRVIETDMEGDTLHYFFQRSGNDYNEYAYVDDYSIMTFEEEIYGNILFLKENMTQNQSWNSAEWTGTDADDGVMKKLRYVFTCTAVNATVSVGGTTFTNVNKVTFKPQTAPSGSTTWTDEGAVWEAWYAKGVGLITLRLGAVGIPFFDLGIRRYQVQ